MKIILRKLDLHIFMKMSKSTLKLTLFLLLQLMIVSTSKSQNFEASISMLASSPGYETGECYIVLEDTIGISNIEIEITNTVLDSVVFLNDFTYDQINGLPSGLTYQRIGNNILLGLGDLPESLGWMGRIRTKFNGSWSDYLEVLFQ